MSRRTSAVRPIRYLALLLTASACAVVGQSDSDHGGPAKPDLNEPQMGSNQRGSGVLVAHRDGKSKKPSFVWLRSASRTGKLHSAISTGSVATDAAAVARAVLPDVAAAYQLSAPALAALGTPQIDAAGDGVIVAKFVQRSRGYEVFRGGLSVLLSRQLEPIAASGVLAEQLEGSEAEATISAYAALQLAARSMLGRELGSAVQSPLATNAADANETEFSAPELAHTARVKSLLFPIGNGVELAYRVELLLKHGGSRSYVVSALDGRVLFENNLVHSDAYTYRAYADPTTLMPLDGPQGNSAAPHPTAQPNGYRVTYGPAPLVTLQNFPFSKNDPWLPADATETVGNNAVSYADLVAPNGFTANSIDLYSTPTAPLAFDWTYDVTRTASATIESKKGAVTNLFYLINFMHDWFYDSGFDEKSGNAQRDNFGRGGRAADPIFAEAQDYSGRNNANASTPADGRPPQIQMYLFGGASTADITVNTPAAIAGVKSAGVTGGFGADSFSVTSAVVFAQDTGADANDACETLANAAAVAGKIVLAHRGNCSFVEKAQRAQAAGAAGLIIANVASSAQPNTAPFMGGTALDVTLPVSSLALADGQALEAAARAGTANATMKRVGKVDLDGALDTSIVTHEWGHVMSNRLVSNADGLNSNEAGGLGEGWADFIALMVTGRPGDAASPGGAGWGGVYPTGSYATSGGGTDSYFGIRRMPYSVDMTKNGLTLKHIENGNPLPANIPISFGEDGTNNIEVHNTGEVWAAMLWECYVALLRDPRYSFADAQTRMKRYLVASLKLTPPDPTLLQARDAVLAAAFATDPQDLLLFWKAFAKRGAGVGAKQPGPDAPGLARIKESFEVGNDAQIVSAVLSDETLSCDHDGVLDEGETASVAVTLRNSGAGTLDQATVTFTTKAPGVVFEGGGVVKVPALKPFESTTVNVNLTATGIRGNEPMTIDVAVTDPTLTNPAPRAVVAARRDADEAEASSAIDRVDTTKTVWTPSVIKAGSSLVPWRRVRDGAEQWWSIPNGGEPSDIKLTSAPFAAKTGTFGLSFKHRWFFESTTQGPKDFDGGVVEVSLDAGKTWKDLSEYGKVDYNVTLVNEAQGSNVLKGRRAFGNKSPGYPTWRTTKVAVDLGAPAASVSLRFREGSDDNAAEAGWDVDDIELTDSGATPFWSFVTHADACDVAGPTATAGAAQVVAVGAKVSLQGGATHPTGKPVSYVWSQVSGLPVVLLAGNTASPNFVAPNTDKPTALAFALRANDGKLVSAAARTEVTVKPAPVAAASGGCGCRTSPRGREETAGAAAGFGMVAAALALARRRRRAR